MKKKIIDFKHLATTFIGRTIQHLRTSQCFSGLTPNNPHS
jgi:hypothetical protein